VIDDPDLVIGWRGDRDRLEADGDRGLMAQAALLDLEDLEAVVRCVMAKRCRLSGDIASGRTCPLSNSVYGDVVAAAARGLVRRQVPSTHRKQVVLGAQDEITASETTTKARAVQVARAARAAMCDFIEPRYECREYILLPLPVCVVVHAAQQQGFRIFQSRDEKLSHQIQIIFTRCQALIPRSLRWVGMCDAAPPGENEDESWCSWTEAVHA